MSEMVERVGNACRLTANRLEAEYQTRADMLRLEFAERAPLEIAAAAIAAMREPTEEMLDAHDRYDSRYEDWDDHVKSAWQ